MLTGQRVVYLCATSMHSSHYWRGMAHLVFPQFFGFLFSAIAYSGEQTKLSIRTSNYEPKYRNLHRLTPNWIRTNISMQLSF